MIIDSLVVSNGHPKSYVQVTILRKLYLMCSIDQLLKYSINGEFTCWEHSLLPPPSLFCDFPQEAQIKSSSSRLKVRGLLYLIGLK